MTTGCNLHARGSERRERALPRVFPRGKVRLLLTAQAAHRRGGCQIPPNWQNGSPSVQRCDPFALPGEIGGNELLPAEFPGLVQVVLGGEGGEGLLAHAPQGAFRGLGFRCGEAWMTGMEMGKDVMHHVAEVLLFHLHLHLVLLVETQDMAGEILVGTGKQAAVATGGNAAGHLMGRKPRRGTGRSRLLRRMPVEHGGRLRHHERLPPGEGMQGGQAIEPGAWQRLLAFAPFLPDGEHPGA